MSATEGTTEHDTRRDVALIGIRLLDDAYMAWAAAEGEAEEKLGAWLDSRGAQSARAYPAYRAALEREEAAARDLQRLHEISASYGNVVIGAG
ncbi:MAG TPA: hypothetical protein VID68_05520 [Solirubrobacteraceae bacterium]|jgi:hypothetical protein